MRRMVLLLVLPLCLLPACSKDDGSAVDVTPPTSAVNALTEETTHVPFAVAWSGTDSGSGIKHFDVQSKDGEGPWVDWITATVLTTSNFAGEDAHTYYFRCRAMDNAGNQEDYPAEADAQTTVVLGPGAEWETTFGGSMNENGNSVQQTAEGGYIVVGCTYSYGAGDRDVYLVKASSTGELEWDETYGGPEIDTGMSVRQTADGGYVIGGSTRSFGAGEQDIYVVKVSSGGVQEWDLVYGGTQSESALWIRQTLDGGYIVTGQAYSSEEGYDICLLKVTSEGETEWYKTYGGGANEFGRAVEQTVDGGYIIVGGTHSFGAGGRDVYLIKVDSSGEVEWQETYGGASEDYGLSVLETGDGGYIIGGQTSSYGAGGVDAYLVKVDSNGDIEWDEAYGGTSDDHGSSVGLTGDGGYVLAGETYSFGLGETDAYLIKMDSNGNLEWSRTFGGTSYDGAASLDVTSDGGYVIAGYSSSYGDIEGDVYLVKIEHE